jgi:hypothetical protein
MAQAGNLSGQFPGLWRSIGQLTRQYDFKNHPRDFPRDASSELSWSFATSFFESKTIWLITKDALSILFVLFWCVVGRDFLCNKLGRQLGCLLMFTE